MRKLGDGDPVRIGAYRLVARLGAGGMGHVYVARSERGRTVAVKLVRRELAEQDEFRDRFRQEVAAARRVGGYWTAPVLDADTEAAVPWVATGYVAGPSLKQVVGRDHGPLPERSVRVLAAGLAHALRDIHAAGIVHRDLKPSNVLVTIDGPRVIDFGIARALETVADGGLTRTGALVGSPGFMAPEQVRGDRVTPAADVFCLGTVLAYAATGALPFGAVGSGAHAMMFRIAQEEPDLTGVPEGVADLVRDCLRKNPADRPTPEQILERTGVPADLVADGHAGDTWLPAALVAQLGRHAVRLLDVETEVEERPGAEAGGGVERSEAASGREAEDREVKAREARAGDIEPEHTPPDEPLTFPAHQRPHPQPFATAPGASQRPPVWPGDPALEEPVMPVAWSRTPSEAPLPYATGRTQPAGRRSRLSVGLGVAALVVTLGAGASIVALLNGDDGTPPVPPTPTPTSSGGSVSPPSGVVPSGLLGTWTASIDNSTGHNTRRLTITQGELGDRVLTLVADGRTETGTYHCVFAAALTERPTGDTLLNLGPSQVTSGEPASSCTPGAASTLTLRKNGTLRRVTAGGGGELTYEKSS
ncbi:serine/threonine-protein kinase [Streptomyces sp. WI04-05B]|uniref:serine/threonine-protein kinase n=1 Tax=Streptomyces TaxID=1883 RepID=UPI0029A6B9A2|nr:MULTISPECIES: serine/threonine-protein kinase [unclassified Streptomyces]MDX2544251.1 serine/threonine-protein kinase [Streptomyces sp. WI04-05B]MDX2584667.1 serine/threonine-protein kinase [Streptomyces sp. WI04-05A]